MVQPTRLAVALAGGVDQGQIAQRLGGDEALFQRHRDALGEADAHEAAGGTVSPSCTSCTASAALKILFVQRPWLAWCTPMAAVMALSPGVWCAAGYAGGDSGRRTSSLQIGQMYLYFLLI